MSYNEIDGRYLQEDGMIHKAKKYDLHSPMIISHSLINYDEISDMTLPKNMVEHYSDKSISLGLQWQQKSKYTIW